MKDKMKTLNSKTCAELLGGLFPTLTFDRLIALAEEAFPNGVQASEFSNNAFYLFANSAELVPPDEIRGSEIPGCNFSFMQGIWQPTEQEMVLSDEFKKYAASLREETTVEVPLTPSAQTLAGSRCWFSPFRGQNNGRKE